MNITDITKQIRAFADQLEEQSKPDPYADLKVAYAAGKVIQACAYGVWYDEDFTRCKMEGFSRNALRIKPAAPPFQLPPPPPGMQWHREDGWKDGMLEKGKRPLVKGETYQKGDLYGTASNWEVVDGLAGDSVDNWPNDDFSKTTRPLVFEHEGKSWTYHRPGDPRPCEDRRIYILCKDGIDRENHVSPNDCRWSEENTADIIGWRYAAPLTREVELGPEDVPPTTVLRGAGEVGSKVWCLITSCSEVGIRIWRQAEASGREITWQRLRESESQINRPRHRDADGNPTLWEKCSKEVPA